MRVLLLGPVVVTSGGRTVSLGRRQERTLLTILALRPGQFVSVDRLADLLWDNAPPRRARLGIQAMVSHIRAALRSAGEHGDRLVAASGGYALHIEPDAVDIHQFRRLVDRARASAPPAERVRLLTEALRLWRGMPMADTVDEGRVRWLCPDAAELRPAALEDLIEARLDLGEHRTAVGELRELVGEHPFRERPVHLLMLSLHRGGRTAEALEAYAAYAQRQAENLGLDPSEALQRLRTEMLGGGSEAATGVDVAGAPAQLPAAPVPFVGRSNELLALDSLLSARSGPAVTVIAGPAGMGKSALALFWAHRARDRFPDGQLFLDLRGYSRSAPMRPIEALGHMMTALGVPTMQIPVSLPAAIVMYRTLVADKRLLLVLDNALSAEQVRPLLPGGRSVRTVMTSRDRLAGLIAVQGARRIELGTMPPDQSGALLLQLISDARMADPAEIAALADICGHMPLALRIVAARLRDDPGQSVAEHLNQLRERRLETLALGDDQEAAVPAALDLSYQRLADPARRMFRSLGLLPGVDLTAPAAAQLAAMPVGPAMRALDTLCEAHLSYTDSDRYSMHDLVRLYAADRGVAEDPDRERGAGIDRLFRWYLAHATGAADALYPTVVRLAHDIAPTNVGDHDAALAWLDTERQTMIGLISSAARTGPFRLAAQLADQLRGYLWIRHYPIEWMTVGQAALTAAEAAEDLTLRAASHLSLGQLRLLASEPERAEAHLRRALRLFKRAGHGAGTAAVTNALGALHSTLGAVGRATRYLEYSISMGRSAGSQSLPSALSNVANLYAMAGNLELARERNLMALELFRASGAIPNAAITLGNLGATCTHLGRFDEAERHLTTALDAAGTVRMGNAETIALINLVVLRCRTGRAAEADSYLNRAIEMARLNSAMPSEASAHNAAGLRHRCLGEPEAALNDHQHALDLARTAHTAELEAEALVGISHARTALDLDGAAAAGEALRIAEQHGLALLAIDAHNAMAGAHAAADPVAARHHAHVAAERSAACGYERGGTLARQTLQQLADLASQGRGEAAGPVVTGSR